jgi:predicted metal-dependent hydrolase
MAGPVIRNAVACHKTGQVSKAFLGRFWLSQAVAAGLQIVMLKASVQWAYSRGKMLLTGSPAIPILLKRSARARRFSLRVSQATGQVSLSMPARARQSEAEAFARAQEGWIRAALARMPAAVGVGHGALIPLEGQNVTLVAGQGRSVRQEGDQLIVPGDPARVAARVAAYLKVRARDRLVAASDHYAAQIGRRVAQVSLRDTRSRWGSCTSDGSLMYSWRLIMAPPRVLDYVAAHEVAHMLEMNHSPRFWAVVERLFPNWQVERAWLKREGGALQSIRFDTSDVEGD